MRVKRQYKRSAYSDLLLPYLPLPPSPSAESIKDFEVNGLDTLSPVQIGRGIVYDTGVRWLRV